MTNLGHQVEEQDVDQIQAHGLIGAHGKLFIQRDSKHYKMKSSRLVQKSCLSWFSHKERLYEDSLKN